MKKIGQELYHRAFSVGEKIPGWFPGRDADLLITYALRFGCNIWLKLMSSALSAMKLMLYDVTDIQHPVPNVTSASIVQRPFCSILATPVPNQTHTRPLLIWP
ncbi:hypothetical protein SY86_05425 [Erwinia tracheiphila]|uniref:Uncharacterized protein n=1 Tax=Erwinia tracheiphila TaxID=65700 RepID=A0A0M2KDG0_9GAMM|nr:hypothetical protein SY86_05425 [Erwinia tracheiphila]